MSQLAFALLMNVQPIALDRPLDLLNILSWQGDAPPLKCIKEGQPTELDWVPESVVPREVNIREGGWYAVEVKAKRSGAFLISLKGHRSLHCNEVEHPGDQGALGVMQWPAPMYAGDNWIYFQSNGDPLLLSVRPVSESESRSVHISQFDRVIPQSVELRNTEAVGSMVVANLTEDTIERASLWSKCMFEPDPKLVGRVYPEKWKPGSWTPGVEVSLAPWSVMFAPVNFTGPPPIKIDPKPYPFDLEFRTQDGSVLSKGKVNLGVRESKDRTWHSFQSELDHSIQRWIRIPRSSGPVPGELSPALFVIKDDLRSATKIALSFEPKDDYEIIVCWPNLSTLSSHEPCPMEDRIFEIITKATTRHDLDTARVGILGYADAGLDAVTLQRRKPGHFCGVGVVSCFPGLSELSEIPNRVAFRWGEGSTSAPPNYQEALEQALDSSLHLIDISEGVGDWWGRKTVDDEPFHRWILQLQG